MSLTYLQASGVAREIEAAMIALERRAVEAEAELKESEDKFAALDVAHKWLMRKAESLGNELGRVTAERDADRDAHTGMMQAARSAQAKLESECISLRARLRACESDLEESRAPFWRKLKLWRK